MQGFFSKKNYAWILAGACLLVVGFLLLGMGPADNKNALNVAPFVLLLAYAVILPLGILWGGDKEEEK